MNTSPRSRHIARRIALVLALGFVPAAATTALPASATVCDSPWGSLVKQRATYSGKQVVDIRAGRHRCFDRLVVDLNGAGEGRPGYHVKYVSAVHQDGSGAVVPLRGGARLRIVVNAPAYDDGGEPTYEPASWAELVDVDGYRTFRQVAWAVSFEGQTTLGLGVRARLPMRAFVLRGPDGGNRLVVDVAHQWS